MFAGAAKVYTLRQQYQEEVFMHSAFRFTFALAALAATSTTVAALELGAPFTDGAVLQRAIEGLLK